MKNEISIGDLTLKCRTWSPIKSGSSTFNYIDLSSVDKDDKSIVSTECLPVGDAPSRARQLVECGDVLVSTVRPNLNGVALVTDAHHGMTASTGYCVLRPIKGELSSEYLFHWVKTSAFIQSMVDVASGANYPAVSDAKVKKSKIPLPPLKEQKRIAEILDAADRLRSIRRKALAQLDVFLQSTFIDLFGDPVTNPKGWEVVKLPAASVKFVDGPFGSNLKTSHYVEHGIRVIRLQDIGVGQLLNRGLAYISREHYESLPRHHCMPGDILIGTMGEPNLRACIMPQSLPEALNKADCLLMRVNSQVALNQYICGLLNCEATVTGALHLVRGQTRGRISLGRLKGLSIPLPPLDVQGQYAQILGKVEIQKQRMQKQLDELDTLFAALQQRAFSGEL